MTREQYLNKIVEAFRPQFKKLKRPLPKLVRCSVGFPYGKRAVGPGATVGQCWAATASKDKVPQIYITPLEDDAFEVAHTVLHELVHAVGIQGHAMDFRELAMQLGLTGKMKASVPGPELTVTIKTLIKRLGPYDHTRLNIDKRPKQGTRLLKVECPVEGYVARVTQKWVDAMGCPVCPCGEIMLLEES